MSGSGTHDDFVFRLKRQLPLAARCRPPLRGFLETRLGHMRTAPRLKVTNVFAAQDASGVLCQFVVEGAMAGESVFVAPLKDIAFERRVVLARQLGSSASRRTGACAK